MSTQPNPDPTPEEIAERCAEIQAEWTPEEKRRRLRADWRSSLEPLSPVSLTTKGTPLPE